MPDQSTGVDLSVNVQTQPKARRGATAVALLSLVIGAMLGPALTNAHADTLSPTVTGATFAHNRDDDADGVPDPVTTADPLLKDASFLLGVDFTLPVPLAVGDTFAIEFPEQIQGSTNPAFPLEAADGTVIGTCAVGPVQFSCELTNPIVADWETTQPFNVYFNAQTIKGTTATTLPFTVVGGGTFEVTGPPGGIGIGAGTSFPNNPRKEGWASPDTLGAIQWVVYLPATTADSITFTDTLGTGEGQDLIVGSVRVYRTPVWNAQNIYDANTVLYPDAELDLTYGGQLQSFTISIPAHADAVAYWVAYRSTVPAGVNWGDEFSNTVSGEQVSTQETVSYNSTAGGTGGGSALPDLVITKAVVNETVPRTYSFAVSCVSGGKTSHFTVPVAAGTTGTVRDLAIGSICTITEEDSFGAAVTFAPGNVITMDDNTSHEVTVTATNTFPVVTTTPVTTPATTPVTVPPVTPVTTPVTPVASPTSSTSPIQVVVRSTSSVTSAPVAVPPTRLAATGADLSLSAALGVALLLLIGGAIAILTVRRSAHRH